MMLGPALWAYRLEPKTILGMLLKRDPDLIAVLH